MKDKKGSVDNIDSCMYVLVVVDIHMVMVVMVDDDEEMMRMPNIDRSKEQCWNGDHNSKYHE
jgi:hypothetical protein